MTTLSPAQQAQQNNRGPDGRYAEGSHAEPDVALDADHDDRTVMEFTHSGRVFEIDDHGDGVASIYELHPDGSSEQAASFELTGDLDDHGELQQEALGVLALYAPRFLAPRTQE